MAPLETHVIVPMLLDAYINHRPPANAETTYDGSYQAYLAPITESQIASHAADNALIQHDIFENIPNLPYIRGRGDPSRITDERSGIYLSWSLPSHYRTGLSASGEDDDIKTELAQGGYANIDSPGTSSTGTRFRQVPNRWVIVLRFRYD